MEEFLKKIKDLHSRCINKNIVTCTGFLTPAERQAILNNFNISNIVFFGGNESCERVRAFFFPDYLDVVDYEEYIVAFKASFSFKELSHRDFLGAILAPGIERRCIGDIFVFKNEAFFFATKDICEFIKTNLNKVGNVGIKLCEIGFDDVKVPVPNVEIITFTVQSLRLDSIVAGAIKLSREKASLLIKNGMVSLNYIECVNGSKEIKNADVFSVKGYGKFCVADCGRITRKGKIVAEVKRFI